MEIGAGVARRESAARPPYRDDSKGVIVWLDVVLYGACRD